MTTLLLAFDILLATSLVALVWRLLASEDLFRSIVLFITFGVLMSICWVRLRSPDLALVEVAIGAGLTGALLLHTLSSLEAARPEGKAGEGRATPLAWRWKIPIALASVALFSVLLWAVWLLPDEARGIGPRVFERLNESGVKNPVTAALLNFRALDTLLEVVVLLVAMIGAWSLQVREPEPLAHPSGVFLERFTRWLVPALVLVAGYLLWAGADYTGGAFQAGAVLGSAGVLWILTHGSVSAPSQRQLLRVLFTVGIFVFVGVGVLMLFSGRSFLDYPPRWSKELILIIEAASTLTIAATLVGLFAGSQRGLEGELAPMQQEGP